MLFGLGCSSLHWWEETFSEAALTFPVPSMPSGSSKEVTHPTHTKQGFRAPQLLLFKGFLGKSLQAGQENGTTCNLLWDSIPKAGQHPSASTRDTHCIPICTEAIDTSSPPLERQPAQLRGICNKSKRYVKAGVILSCLLCFAF